MKFFAGKNLCRKKKFFPAKFFAVLTPKTKQLSGVLCLVLAHQIWLITWSICVVSASGSSDLSHQRDEPEMEMSPEAELFDPET